MRSGRKTRNLSTKAAWATAIVLVAGGLFALAQSVKSQSHEVTMKGRIVDLYCAMTGEIESSDHVKCTRDCLKSGVPAALETENGIVLLGKGNKGAMKLLTPFAYQEVQITGRLFEKSELKYLDIGAISPMIEEPQESDQPIGGYGDKDSSNPDDE